MRGVNACSLAAWVMLMPIPGRADFTAYNDCSPASPSGDPANTTSFGPGQSGPLKDFASGTTLNARVSIVNSSANTGGTGGPIPNVGTDAYATFNGKVVFGDPVIYYRTGVVWWVDTVFSNLNPNAMYTVALSANRQGTITATPPYTNRWTRWTLSGVDAATNASSAGVSNLSPTAVAFCTGDNTANGYVARWTGIRCGTDGVFTVRAECHPYGTSTYHAYGPEAVMLQELSTGGVTRPPSVALIGPTNGATVGTNLLLQATATDDGAITNVAFYSDGVKLASLTALPYAFAWYGAPTGSHELTARAWNGQGLCATSAPAVIRVVPARRGPGIAPVAHVIHVSVDGLRPDAITTLGPTNLPNFYRLRTQGAFTDNARNDYDITVTLPNHTTQLTGRGVLGAAGHAWTSNSDPAPGQTLASNKGAYIAGVFDVAHDHGLRTAEYASKSKFSLFANSWDATNGAPDLTGIDNGRNKIDVYLNMSSTSNLVDALVAVQATQACDYVFLHLADPDAVGHASGWDVTPGSAYCNAVIAMDRLLGRLFTLVDSNALFRAKTLMIVTADHGGLGTDHSNPAVREDYTIPFYVWGPGVSAGADLYALNVAARLDPAAGRPLYTDPVQPVRNGECANLTLNVLGLAPVPGATLNAAQDLVLAWEAPAVQTNWAGCVLIVK